MGNGGEKGRQRPSRARLTPMDALRTRPPRDTGPIELRDYGPSGRRLGIEMSPQLESIFEAMGQPTE